LRSVEAAEQSLEGTLLRDLLIREGMERAVDAAVSGWHSEPRRGLDDEESFMEWRDDVSAHLPPSARWAADVVQVSGRVPAPLAATLIVSGAAEAMELWDRLAALPGHRVGSPPLQIVTLDGCLISGMGVRRHVNDDRGLQYLELRGQLTRLEARATRLLRYLGWLEAAEASHRIAAEEADAHVATARGDASARRGQLSAAEIDMQRVSQRRQRLETERAERDRERMGLATEVNNLETAIAERLEQERALDNQVLRANEDSLSAGKALAAAREAHEAAVRTEREAGHDEAILSRRVEAQGDIVRLAEAEIARLMAQPEKLERELESMREALGDAQGQLSVAETRIGELRTTVSECEDRLEAERAQRPSPGPAPSDLRITRQASDAAIAAYEQAAARRAHLAAARARLEAEIERELGPDGLHDLHVGDEEAPTEEEIRRLRQRAAQYADYDVSVIGEYAELRERQAYLSSQIADLKEAAAGLRDVMAVADKEMRVRFSRALNLVSAEFDRVFRLMLRGGEAMLEQTEDGGIEVRALLPGKRTRSSSSFSGGERALVTSALLFGVLRIRPAPFCVLDEVDAALDETNVDRYLDALRELSEHTQTLVVTHNRATMAAATVLYGLTMDAEGCSGLLSLRLDQYDAVS
jgi:chromosome segregation protein